MNEYGVPITVGREVSAWSTASLPLLRRESHHGIFFAIPDRFEATKCLFLTWDALDLVYKWRHSFRTLSLRYLKPRGADTVLRMALTSEDDLPCVSHSWQMAWNVDLLSGSTYHSHGDDGLWELTCACGITRTRGMKQMTIKANLLKVVWSACFIERAGHTLYVCACSSYTYRLPGLNLAMLTCQASVLSLSYVHSPFRNRICLSCPVWTWTCSIGRCRTHGPFASASPVTLLRPGLPLPFHNTGAVLFPFVLWQGLTLWLQI